MTSITMRVVSRAAARINTTPYRETGAAMFRGFPLANPNPPVAGNANTWLGSAIILDGVAEVYTMGTIRLP